MSKGTNEMQCYRSKLIIQVKQLLVEVINMVVPCPKIEGKGVYSTEFLKFITTFSQWNLVAVQT